jgi:hypothetical protein
MTGLEIHVLGAASGDHRLDQILTDTDGDVSENMPS